MEDMIKGSDLLETTWVVTSKETDVGQVVKARLCARGDMELTEVWGDSPTVSKLSLRLVFLLAANQGWCLEISEAKSAFFQGDKIDRAVYLVKPVEYESVLPKGGRTVWKLKKRIYGLSDASGVVFESGRGVNKARMPEE